MEMLREEYFTLLNFYRQTYGERSLIEFGFINRQAQMHAEDMALGVVSFGHSGNIKRCEAIKREFTFKSTSMCGEMIASGPDTAGEILSSWTRSHSSKEKILNPSYIYTGIGIHRNSEGKVFWVQIFLEGL